MDDAECRRRWLKSRRESFHIYTGKCPVTMRAHDWRYASHAPGRKAGDICALCQDCKQRAIRPAAKE